MAFDHDDGSCLECSDGHAVKRTNKSTDEVFHGCSNFPRCRSTEPIRARTTGDFLLSQDDADRVYYDAFYDGDG